MLKTLLIGLKDVRLAFRDRAALILMLAAPFVLTIGLGFVTGRFSGNKSSIANIPVILVNQDGGQLGNALVDVFNSQDLAGLVEPTASSDPEAARRLIDEDKAAAAVIIPAGFTNSIIPQADNFNNTNATPIQIEVYVNPTRPTSAGVIKSIVDEFVSRVEESRTSGMTAILQMIKSGIITPQQAQSAAQNMTQRLQSSPSQSILAIQVNTTTSGGAAMPFDVLAYMAPGMALMFLMYTVTHGARSIFVERTQGTLPRLLVSPTNTSQILGGKVFGIFLTGLAQMLILISASSLFFQLKWGDPLGVVVLVIAAVFGATGWGMLIASIARTSGQVSTIGTTVMLIFGILGGSFIQLSNMPPIIQAFSRITPNAWALDGFTTLGLGDTLADLGTPIAALLIMGSVLFVVAVILFGRRNLIQK